MADSGDNHEDVSYLVYVMWYSPEYSWIISPKTRHMKAGFFLIAEISVSFDF